MATRRRRRRTRTKRRSLGRGRSPGRRAPCKTSKCRERRAKMGSRRGRRTRKRRVSRKRYRSSASAAKNRLVCPNTWRRKKVHRKRVKGGATYCFVKLKSGKEKRVKATPVKRRSPYKRRTGGSYSKSQAGYMRGLKGRRRTKKRTTKRRRARRR